MARHKFSNSGGSSDYHQDALKSLIKHFGPAFDGRAIAMDCYEAIPTGHDDIDAILTRGAKGIIKGGVVEIFGLPGGGKSSLAMRIVAQAQKTGYRCLWVDAESGFSPDLAEVNGINLDELVVPDLSEVRWKSELPFPSAGDLLDMVYNAVLSAAFTLIVVDSVAGLNPVRVLKEDFDPNKPGVSELARSLSEQLSRLKGACKKFKNSVVFINQIRARPGDMWHPETTPGGNALPFYSDQRIRVDKINGVKGQVIVNKEVTNGEYEDTVIGHYARVSIPKNKKHRPYLGYLQIPVYYEKYDPDNAKKCYDAARVLQVITMRKGVFTWKDNDELVINKIEGESEVLSFIRENKLENRLAHACVKAAQEEKNKSKKDPYRVPVSIANLAVSDGSDDEN